MPDANRPAGPGKPIHEQRDAAAEQEEIDELIEDRSAAANKPQQTDAERDARRAARDAHVTPRSPTPTSGRGGGDNPDRS